LKNPYQAFAALRNRSNMPLDRLFDPGAIVGCDGEALVDLLSQMKRCYSGMLPRKKKAGGGDPPPGGG